VAGAPVMVPERRPEEGLRVRPEGREPEEMLQE
jgi:hypothetical protein